MESSSNDLTPGALPIVPANDLAREQLAMLAPAELEALANLQLSTLSLPQLIDHLMQLLAGVDPATGEVSTRLGEAIDALNLSLERKVEAYAHVAQRLQAEHHAYEQLAEAYRRKAKQREAERAALRARLQTQFERLETRSVKTPSVTAYLQSSPTALELTVLDDAEVPDEFCDRVPNMARIRAALDAGRQLSFARLASRQHLRFR